MKVIVDLQKIIEPILDGMGIELIEATLFNKGGRFTLYVAIDKGGGVKIEDTGMVSSMLRDKLDEIDLISGDYVLEVSSPVIERKLTKLSHFKRFTGSKVKLKTHKAIDGIKVFEGTIKNVATNNISIETESKIVVIDFDNISNARLVVDFDFGNKKTKY